MGPVVSSQQYDPALFTYMEVFEWEVANGFTIDAPLPFGMFAEVTPMNMNKAKLRVRLAPGYPDTPLFSEVCVADRSLNGALISSVVCRQVVPIATPAEFGPSIWESVVEPIDGTHGMMVTRHDPVIFEQKSITVIRPDVLPERFKALRSEVETSQTVPGDIGLPTLNTGDTMCSESQVSPRTKTVTKRKQGDTTNNQLDGSQNYLERVKATTVELLVNSNVPADSGLLVIDSKVTELGNGQYVKETVLNPTAWPIHKGSVLDDELHASIGYTEQFVAPPASTTLDPNTEYTPINVDRSLKRVQIIPTATLDSRIHTFPQRADLQLPRVLKSISVIWNAAAEQGAQTSNWQGFSVGRSYSLSANLSDGSSASAAATPVILIELQDIWSSNLPAKGWVFYLKNPVTEAQILARVNAREWPVFHPQSHTIVGLGSKVGCSVRVSIAGSSSGSESNQTKDGGSTQSYSKDVSLTNDVIQIPPTIHSAIDIQGELSRVVSAVASGSMQASGFNFPSLSAALAIGIAARGVVYPAHFPATPGQHTIPRNGKYLINSQVTPYKWGYSKVYAQTFNANVLEE